MSKQLFDKYANTYGIRFSRRQKKRAAAELRADMAAAGYDSFTVLKGRKLLSRAEDLFFGNLKMMKTVIVVPYDTPERKFWKNVPYYPLNGTKTMNKTMLATFVPIVILYLFIFVGLWGSNHLLTSAQAAVFTSFLMFLLVIFLLYLMIHGIANRRNYDRNSIALAKAVELAGRLNKDEKRRVAFLFTDKNKSIFVGASAAEEAFVKAGKNPNIICMDCIGWGSELQIGYNPQNRKLAMELAQHFKDKKKQPAVIKLDESMRMQSAMLHFRHAVVVSAGEKDKDGQLCVYGTSTGQDKRVDMEAAEKLTEMIYGYLHAQK